MGTPEEPVAAPPRWSLARRVAFRFACAYLLLYNLPFPLDAVPIPTQAVQSATDRWVIRPYQEAWDAVVVLVGRNVFDVGIIVRPAGSGDTTWNYVQVCCFLALAAAVTLLWSLLDPRRPNYERLHEWLRVYVRFALAVMMVRYGAVKVIKTQFPTPGVENLMVPYGESSPMRLLWTFMGASEAYNVFSGTGEMLGGLLLCFRRTTLLGAIVSFGVLAHVVALNFCYDVPVKLFSLHLLLMAFFLIVPDLPWLAQVFVLGRRVAPRERVPLTRWKWVNRGLAVFRTVVVIAVVGEQLFGAYQMRHASGDLAVREPLYGYWEVEEFEADGQVRPPLTTDRDRWHHVALGRRWPRGSYLGVTTMTGAKTYYAVAVDADQGTLRLTRLGGPQIGQGPPPAAEVAYRQPEEGVLAVDGNLDGRAIKARLRYVDPSQFLLMNRGFHWINETPYNMAQPRGGAAERGRPQG
jgi:hypothetical protein